MKSQKGIALYLSVVILAIILAMVFGLSAILFNQIRTIRGMGSSVMALYAADAGIERALYDYYEDGSLESEYDSEDLQITFSNESSYHVTVFCCEHGEGECEWDGPTGENPCPSWIEEDLHCEASHYCIRSVGKAEPNVQRAIEVRISPVD